MQQSLEGTELGVAAKLTSRTFQESLRVHYIDKTKPKEQNS